MIQYQMEKRKVLLWVIAIFLIVALLYLIIYDYQNIPVWRKGPNPAPLFCLGGTSILLIAILTILLVFIIRNLRKT